jgi:hypothetical protein
MRGTTVPDHQRIVNEVRGIVRSGNQTVTERVRELAGQFAHLCASASSRLQRCEEYVFQGRRSEAVQLARVQPPLLELLAALNFPERPQWDELAAVYGLPACSAIDTGRAVAVNAAFAEIQSQETLLREHRRMNMARAPVVQRLTIVRELFGQDKWNPSWLKEIETLEAARVKELQTEFGNVVWHGHSEKTLAIWNELVQSQWQNPPTEFIESVRQWVVQVQQQKAKVNLKQIANDLSLAMARRDIAGARELRQKWDYEIAQHAIQPDETLTRKTSQPIEWLADMEMLVQKLHTPDLEPDEINYQYSLMDKWQRFLPPNLENAYQNHVSQINRKSVGRERKILAIVAIVCIALLFVFFALIFLLR